MTSNNLANQIERLNALYVGPHGHGKTTAMASMAHLGKMKYFDFESGLKAGPLRRLGIPIENIEVVRVKTYQELEDEFWKAKGNLDQYDEDHPDRLQGLAFDSMTELQAKLVEASVDRRVSKELRKVDSAQNEVKADQFFTGQDDYGYWTNQARRITRMFRDLDCHIAFGTLQKREVGDDGVKLVPQLTQAFRVDIMGYVDMIAHMVTAENNHVAHPDKIEFLGIMRALKLYCGKDRYGVTPVVLANPRFDKLVALVNETHDLDADPDHIAYTKRMAELQGPTQLPEDEGEPQDEPNAE